MSYFDSPKHRRTILDKLRLQMQREKDRSLLDGLDFSDWDDAFDYLNNEFWNGQLRKIPVTTTAQKGSYGLFCYSKHSSRIELARNKGLSPQELLGVLLHEMCHHYVHETYRHGLQRTGKRVIGHGKEWKAEMRRVGYTGKITRFTGKNRFTTK